MTTFATLNFNDTPFDLVATGDALEQVNTVGTHIVTGNILAFGPDRIARLAATCEDAAMIDKKHSITAVVTISERTIEVISVIKNTDVFVKNKTTLKNI